MLSARFANVKRPLPLADPGTTSSFHKNRPMKDKSKMSIISVHRRPRRDQRPYSSEQPKNVRN